MQPLLHASLDIMPAMLQAGEKSPGTLATTQDTCSGQCARDHQGTCHALPKLSAQGVADTGLIERWPMQNMWNRKNGTAQKAFALRFIFTAQEQREVTFRIFQHLPRLLCTPASGGALVLWT